MVKETPRPPLTTYETLKQIEGSPLFRDLLRCGIIPINFIDYKVIFEYYLEREKIRKTKTQAEADTAAEFNQSERNVRYIIKKMRD